MLIHCNFAQHSPSLINDCQKTKKQLKHSTSTAKQDTDHIRIAIGPEMDRYKWAKKVCVCTILCTLKRSSFILLYVEAKGI